MARKLLIILPEGKIHRLKIGSFIKSFRESPLTATTLAALVPEDLSFDIQIADESIGQNPFLDRVDLVAISCMTGTSTRAYEIADYYRSRNVIVVMGGVHVTLLPNEAIHHADTIVIGFAEHSWPQLLRDFCADELKDIYNDQNNHYNEVPVPRRNLQKNEGYMIPNVVSATRGCKGSCDFCSVSAANFGWQTRPLDAVIDEIKSIHTKRFVFNDVSMGEDMIYFKQLLREMIPLRKKWGGLVSMKVFHDDEIYDLLQQSGCVYLLIGFESLNDKSLININKGFNRFDEYKEVIRRLHKINIVLMGCFIFGFDDDDLSIFKKTVDFVNETKISIPRYAIYTPYPKTPAFEKMESEGRLLHKNWYHYDTQHVVFQPKHMTPQELDNGFKWAFKQSYSFGSSLKRTLATGKNFPITFGGNLAYNIYLKRLFSEENRILYK